MARKVDASQGQSRTDHVSRRAKPLKNCPVKQFVARKIGYMRRTSYAPLDRAELGRQLHEAYVQFGTDLVGRDRWYRRLGQTERDCLLAYRARLRGTPGPHYPMRPD